MALLLFEPLTQATNPGGGGRLSCLRNIDVSLSGYVNKHFVAFVSMFKDL